MRQSAFPASNGMILLTIGSDRSLFRPSKAQDRVAAYGRAFDRMEIIILSPPGFEPVKIAPNVTVHPASARNRLWRLVEAYRLGKRILVSLCGEKNIVVSCQDPFESGLVGYFLAKTRSLPLHLQIHTDFLSPYFVRENFLNRIRMYAALFLIPQARCIRVVSERIKKSLMAKLNIQQSKIAVLPIWSSAFSHIRSPRQSNADFTILMAARLEPEKGIEDGILAFQKFLALGGKGRLVIAGDGSLRNTLEAMTRNLGLGEKISFAGWQNNLLPYYRGADVYMMTSHYEGWGVSAYDAACAGIPVVMTDVGLAGEAVKNGVNGIVIKVRDIEGIANALLSVSQDSHWREPLPNVKSNLPRTFDEYLLRYREAMERCVVHAETLL